MLQGSSTSQYHNLNLIWVNDIALIYLIPKLYWLILHLSVVGQTSIKLLISFRLSGEHICTRVLSIPSILLIIVIITVMAVPFSISTLWICKRKRCNEAMDIDFSLLPACVVYIVHTVHCAVSAFSVKC